MFVVGHTAGHVYPALAVADALRRIAPARDHLFVAPRSAVVERLLSRAGVRIATVDSLAIKGAGPAGAAAALARVVPAFRHARRLLARERPRGMLSFGSYTSGAPMLAARSLGIPTFVHEANIVPGLANRWLAPVAHRFYVAHEEAARRFPAGRTRVVGAVTRSAFAAQRALCPADGAPVRILVTTGSRGAALLAREVPALLRAVGGNRPFEVVHQIGDACADVVRQAYAAAGVRATVVPFIEEVAAEMGRAHVAITRGGAGTLAELAACGLPAIVVPLADAADDHQSANGRWFAAAGAGLCVPESQFGVDAASAWLRAVVNDPPTWRRAADAARSLACDTAADVMAADIAVVIANR